MTLEIRHSRPKVSQAVPGSRLNFTEKAQRDLAGSSRYFPGDKDGEVQRCFETIEIIWNFLCIVYCVSSQDGRVLNMCLRSCRRKFGVHKVFLAVVVPDVTQFLHWSIMNHHEPSMMNQSWGSHFWCHIPRFLVQAPRCKVRATRWNWCEARTSWEPMQNDPLKCLFSKVSEQGE